MNLADDLSEGGKTDKYMRSYSSLKGRMAAIKVRHAHFSRGPPAPTVRRYQLRPGTADTYEQHMLVRLQPIRPTREPLCFRQLRDPHYVPASPSSHQQLCAVQEAQDAQQGRTQKRCENLALLQAQLEHEQVEQAQRDKIESLKAHLASVVDRTTRIRSAYEKEKRQLTSQARCRATTYPAVHARFDP